MSDLPPLTEPNVLYAGIRLSEGRGEVFYGFFPFVSTIWICRDHTEIARVRIRERTEEDPPSDSYAWQKTDEDRMCMVQPAAVLFDMQSPDGFKRAEEAGEGHRVNIHVEVLERFPILTR